MKHYLWQILIALDQLANALLLGYADETLSARAYRAELKGRLWGYIFRPLIDGLFFVITLGNDREHCRVSYHAELMRRHLPPAYADAP